MLDEVFEANRQRPYPPKLLFSCCRGVDDAGKPELAAFAARGRAQNGKSARVANCSLRQGQAHGVAAAARLGQVSSARLQSSVAALDEAPCVPGWQVRVVDGNYLPSSQKRLLKCKH